MQPQSQVELPPEVGDSIEVYVNGVRKQPGVDFERRGSILYFPTELSTEGRLGFWRWLSLFLGVAGTYRRNDKVDVVAGGRVITLTPVPVVRSPA